MTQRTLGFVATVCVAAGAGSSPLNFLKTVIMPDGRVIQISAGNPND